jgi:predicted protein tyrosine phosphatase
MIEPSQEEKMMSRIANVSLFNFMLGRFNSILVPEQTIAIRILETDSTFPENQCTGRYKETHFFNFDDVDEVRTDHMGTHHPISAKDAAKIYDILVRASEMNIDVIVHCAAGICRSGAVAQFAIDYLGFVPAFHTQMRPNLAVKRAMIAHHDTRHGVDSSYVDFWENLCE